MKKIFILVSTLLLTACVNLSYDALEYDRYLSIYEKANNVVSLCGTPAMQQEVSTLKQEMDHQFLYTMYRPSRSHITTAADNLKEIVDGMYIKYQQPITPSKVYCEEKLRNISDGVTPIITTLGKF
jgi:uncharacterized lipoprotein YajG